MRYTIADDAAVIVHNLLSVLNYAALSEDAAIETARTRIEGQEMNPEVRAILSILLKELQENGL